MQRVKEKKIADLSKVLFIGVQHKLETTASLFKAFIDIGADPKKMLFTGKCYSTNKSVALAMQNLGINLVPDSFPKKVGEYQKVCREGLKNMWKQAEIILLKHKDIEKIVVIDDGFRCIEEMPNYLRLKYAVGLVEQTRGGLYSGVVNALPLPLVDHATSAAKKRLEAPKIGKAIFRAFDKYIAALKIDFQNVCGVMGNGAIGNEIVSNLLKRGYTVVVYDKSEEAFKNFSKKIKNLIRVQDPLMVIANSEFVFTCVGDDWSKNLNIFSVCKNKKKVFINCASENKDMESFLSEVAAILVSLNQRIFYLIYYSKIMNMILNSKMVFSP